jgi:HEAT repeat protein
MPQNKPPQPPDEMQEKSIATADAAALIGLLKDANASEFQKAKACMRLGELGAKEAVPALAALLADERMSTYARYGLEPIADAAADEALRAALGKLKGNLQIGVINSLGQRRDAASGPMLAKLLVGPDGDLARAAAAALGKIGNAASAKELTAALAKASGPNKSAVADAALVCAERMLADGKRDAAMALYNTLSAPSMPKPARLAAMSGIIREETSTSRPR